jgi:pterin-4a-carbinolamine dehydratase
MKTAFISYRRSDSSDIARHLAVDLREEFGAGAVYFDVSSNLPGTAWPQMIRDAIEQADALLVVIGPQWLHTYDPLSGRRRIDLADDWVRLETVTFLQRMAVHPDLLILPLLVHGAPPLRLEYLDGELARLCATEPLVIPTSPYTHDFSQVKQALIRHRFVSVAPAPVVTPSLAVPPQPLTAEEELAFCTEYPEWQIVERPKPGIPGDMIRELYRKYEFLSYDFAWEYLVEVDLQGIRAQRHHPRWQNSFNRVEFWLCTSNSGHKPSKRDVRFAKTLESIWLDFKKRMLLPPPRSQQ